MVELCQHCTNSPKETLVCTVLTQPNKLHQTSPLSSAQAIGHPLLQLPSDCKSPLFDPFSVEG